MSLLTARVPRYLHRPVQLLCFYPDDLAVGFGCYGIWLAVDTWWTLLGVGIGPCAYMIIKADKPRGWLAHLFIKYGLQRLAGYPPAHNEHFAE